MHKATDEQMPLASEDEEETYARLLAEGTAPLYSNRRSDPMFALRDKITDELWSNRGLGGTDSKE